MAYHPSLLPAESWAGIVGNLSDHFGEDAGIANKTNLAAIAGWLAANASDSWDTLAANRLGHAEAEAEASRPITGNSWWKRRHRHIADTIFRQKNIRSHGNCAACHGDAGQGLFAPQAIKVPKVPS
jgi:mono/diheme cytochrome c family protein